MIFVLLTRWQLLKIVRFLFLLILLAALILGVYGVVRTAEVMANRSRESPVPGREKPAAGQTLDRERDARSDNVFDKLIKRLRDYHKGDLQQ
ncbi:MAG: hypothetical protein AB1510_07245 [Bacillota bacterium]